MMWRHFVCWACMFVVGSAIAWSVPASAQEGDVSGAATASGEFDKPLQRIESDYPVGSGGVGYVPPGMEMGSGYVGGMPFGYPGGLAHFVQYDAGSLPDLAAAQREQLIATLRQLQDAYCRAAMLDQAIDVRDQIQTLESLRNASLPPVAEQGTFPIPGMGGPGGIDDGAPYSLRGRNDESFYSEVTGRTTGSVWGDGVYTDDSDLATAAVHAGVLKEGETKIVKFTILPGKDSYAASSANGVETRQWGAFSGSFRVDAAAIRIGYPYTLRGQGLERLQVFVIGSANAGTVWGADVYTDDSALDAAAVHAGVVSEGEKAIVMIELLAGRDSYEGSERNGVTSRPYSSWDASYRFLPDDSGALSSSKVEDAFPTTESPYSLRGQNGKTFIATVTGSTGGSVWGDGVYTDDSDLATAAVHAGVLEEGETGSVRFTILPGQDSYDSSTKNGVSTGSWSSYGGSYRIEGADKEESTSGTRETVTVTGSTNGYVWGSGVYTSDSDLGTAAVHASVVGEGQTATVEIEQLPGRDSYEGSESNGVTSYSYGAWSASFRFVNDPPVTILNLRAYGEER